MNARRPSREELELFGRTLKDAVPLRREPPVAPDPLPDAPPPTEAPPPATRGSRTGAAGQPGPMPADPGPSALTDHAPGAAPGMDRRTQLRLKRGQLPIEARLDLHGLGREKARAVLAAFLARQEALDRRCVLVITGKGRAPWGRDAEDRPDPFAERADSGVIRRSLPQWLGDSVNAQRVLAFAPAQPQHGGHGAWYVLLRRRRAARSGR